MKTILMFALGASLLSCSQPPSAQAPLPPPIVAAPKVEETPIVREPESTTTTARLDKLQGQLEWVTKRIPKGDK